MEKDYSLTESQKKAFRALARAVKRCEKENIYLWDNYGSLTAVNGDVVLSIHPVELSHDDFPELEHNLTSVINSKNWYAGNSDDPLCVEFK